MENQINFKEGGYYSLLYSSPQGSPSAPLHFFITKLNDKGIAILKYGNGNEEEIPVANLEDDLENGYKYKISTEQAFLQQLEENVLSLEDNLDKYISSKQNNITQLRILIARSKQQK
jgi:hypothetical protein